MLNKKAVSPLIATIVLISFTIAIGSLVINWAKQFITAQTQSLQQAGVQCQKESIEIISAKVVNKTSGNVSFIIRNSGSVEFKFLTVNVYFQDGSVETVGNFTSSGSNCGKNSKTDCLVGVSEVKDFSFIAEGVKNNKTIQYIELPSKDCPQNLYYNYNVEQ